MTNLLLILLLLVGCSPTESQEQECGACNELRYTSGIIISEIELSYNDCLCAISGYFSEEEQLEIQYDENSISIIVPPYLSQYNELKLILYKDNPELSIDNCIYDIHFIDDEGNNIFLTYDDFTDYRCIPDIVTKVEL